MREPGYIAIDLKSFYASVECMERNLDPLTTNLVVADPARSEKTICLAVSPSLKAHGIPGRARYFEVVQKVRAANADRKLRAPYKRFTGESTDALQLDADPSLSIAYITAVPRMALYVDYSTRVYSVYLKYFSPDDIHVYSIDEVLIDATGYLKNYRMSAHELTKIVLLDVLRTTGITATAGIGTNLYLAKVAMDIMAKKVAADEDGVRIAHLDEMSYRRQLWTHKPLKDFWRVGKGYVQKLEKYGIQTMGDIARYSIHSEDLLFRLFGVNAELLIDHAWGYEPCTMADIKKYRPSSRSIGSGQVLHTPYEVTKARLVVREMADMLAMELVDKHLLTAQLVLTLGYDIESLAPERGYTGPIVTDSYGRKLPQHAHGSINLDPPTASGRCLTVAAMELFDRIINKNLLVRRINLVAGHVLPEKEQTEKKAVSRQLDLFSWQAASNGQCDNKARVETRKGYLNHES